MYRKKSKYGVLNWYGIPTFVDSDNEGMAFHWDESTVAIYQVSQVLRRG